MGVPISEKKNKNNSKQSLFILVRTHQNIIAATHWLLLNLRRIFRTLEQKYGIAVQYLSNLFTYIIS